ncbi:MAG: DUF488 domain-containing protein [Actinomyces sp.]|nr:DUF488 domain-containing protein [Actinomyces sp.]
MTLRLCTIGHSTRTLEEFTEILESHGITTVVDIRRIPGSAHCPQFDADTLARHLGGHGMELRRLEALTGRRGVSCTIPFEVNAWWRNRSFHNYADHALSAPFRSDLSQVRDWGARTPTVLMCAEAVWWRCHRRIIADHLLAQGDEVLHILDLHHCDPARLSEGARIAPGPDHQVTYPA